MEITFEFWYLFPVSILIATTAMASGIEGGTFFAPLFLLLLRLPPDVAIGTALITEVFGFASGLFAYIRRKLIDYRLGLTLLIATMPMALVGTWLNGIVPGLLINIVLALGLAALAYTFLRSPSDDETEALEREIGRDFPPEKAETCLTNSEGEEICYTVCNRAEGMTIAGIGGLFIGMVSTGQGELNGYFLLKRCRIPSAVAVATSVFVVAVTALVASGGHFIRFAQEGGEVLNQVVNIVVFTIPGVMIGGQLGPLIANRIPQKVLEKGLAFLFIFIALITVSEVVFRQIL